MTEDEAKTKNCPMFGVATLIAMVQLAGEPGAQTALPVIDAGRRCEGSACMWGCDASGNWRGNCGLTPTPLSLNVAGPSVPLSIMRGKMGDPIGKGVYNNPQPGDADFPAGQKTDIGSGG
jgi:hypothetical protein